MTAAFFSVESGGDRPLAAEDFMAVALQPHASVVIEACAGSGKTWLLIARIVRCLLQSTAPGEILAITFTNRAAQEMRQRLLDRLRLLATAPEAEVLAELARLQLAPTAARAALPRARALLEQVLEAEPGPTIETFHGWFLRLLALAPLASGVGRRLVTAERPGALRDTAWRAFCAELLTPPAEGDRAAFERMVDELGAHSAEQLLRDWLARHTDLELALAAGLDSARLQRDFQLDGTAPFVELAADVPLRAALRRLFDLAAPCGAKPKEAAALCTELEPLLAASAADAVAAAEWVRRLAAAVQTKEAQPRKLRFLRAALGSAGLQHEFDTVMEQLSAALNTAFERDADAAHYALTVDALACFQRLTRCYRAVQAERGEIDFGDIEGLAARLMGDETLAAAVHARLDQRYRQILVDEVQDTNPLQWRVLHDWLAAYGEIGEIGEDASRPQVFLVGDPKQSIYRFRRAEPRLFAYAADWLHQHYGARRLRTDHTRRSAPAIVALLNRALTGTHPAFAAHSTQQQTLPGAVRLLPPPQVPALLPTTSPATLRDPLTEPAPAEDVVTALLLGRRIAAEIGGWVGRYPVVTSAGERPARWSDVLVLVRARTHLPAYERALREAGIPHRTSRRGGLLDTLEAEDLQALLSFLVTPFSDLHLAQVLRTPLIGCTDDDLIALARTPGAHWWQRLSVIDGATQPRLAAARERLARWRGWAQRLPVHDLLDHVFFETDALAAYAAAVPPPARERTLANLRAYLQLALAIDAGRYPSLPRFVQALREYRAGTDDDAPGEGLAAGDDAVRILTVHEAKGLEAPIVVVVPSPAAARGEYVQPLVIWPPQAPAPVHVSVTGRKGRRGRARAHWLREEEEQAAREDLNLLYVALTRARQVLIVAGTGSAERPHPWYQLLAQAAPEAVVAEVAVADRMAVGGVAAAGPVSDYRPAPLAIGARRSSADHDALRLGRALHQLLEWATREPPLRLPAAEVAATVLDLAVPQAQQVLRCAQQILQAERLRDFFDPARYRWARAEMELIAPDGVHRPDRVVELDGVLWVLDFKWQVREDEWAVYQEQLARYEAVLRLRFAGLTVMGAIVTGDGALYVSDRSTHG
jgi:ATP-dependent helicase/nuclease subunit A